jgi:hypothetical protein
MEPLLRVCLSEAEPPIGSSSVTTEYFQRFSGPQQRRLFQSMPVLSDALEGVSVTRRDKGV